MLLASVSAIRADLGFDSMTDINAAIVAALEAAEPQLEAALHTPFTRAEATDTFWVKHPPIKDGPFRETQFWFRRGFIAAAPTIAATQQADGSTFPVAGGAVAYDLEKGVARDWTTAYWGTMVAFTYTAGFEADQSDPASYKLQQVPSWLQEAAKLMALTRLADSPPVTEAGIEIDTATIKVQLDAMLGKHVRYAPMALTPL